MKQKWRIKRLLVLSLLLLILITSGQATQPASTEPAGCTPDPICTEVVSGVQLIRVNVADSRTRVRPGMMPNGSRANVQTIVNTLNAALGINADYFSGGCSSNCWMGATFLDGVDRTVWGESTWSARRNIRWSRIKDMSIDKGDDGLLWEHWNSVGGGPQFVKDGAFWWDGPHFYCLNGSDDLNTCGGHPDQRKVKINDEHFDADPRSSQWFYADSSSRMSAVGFSGSTLILAASDGSISNRTMGNLLASQGATHGFRLDGGGSTQMYYPAAGIDIYVLEGSPPARRRIANALLVYFDPAGETPPHLDSWHFEPSSPSTASNVEIYATGSDPESGVALIEFQYNDAPDGSTNGTWHKIGGSRNERTDTSPFEGHVTWNTSSLGSGTYRIGIVLTNGAGQRVDAGTQQGITYQIERTPSAPSNLFASATGQNSIRLTWTDNSSNEDGFKIFRNGSQSATVGANTTSYDDNGLSCSTTYSYYVKSYNSAGDSDPSNTASATTDNCPPPDAPSLSSPSNSAFLPSCENLTLDWDESNGASEYYAEYWGTNSGNSGWTSSTDWNIGTKSPGVHYWHVKARNQWGDSDWSATWSFTVNSNQAPNIPSPQSPGDSAWVNSRTVTLQWQDNGDPDNCPRDYRTYNVEISRSGWNNSASNHSGTSWQVTVPSDDDYQWRVQAYDGDLTSPWSGYRTVKVDATPPDTTITSGPQDDIPVGDASFSWTGSDNRTPTGDMVYSYRLRGLTDNWSEWAGSTSVSYSGLPDGDYTFEVKARDLAGNEDPTPASRSFFVDTTPPDTTITSGPSGCIGTADATFTWTGSDNRTPTDQLLYSLWLEGYDIGWAGWSTATSKTYTGLPDGPYTFHVKARDGVGHEDPSPAGRSFQVDTTPPAGSVLVNGGDSTANKIAVRLDITGDDGPLGCGVTQMHLANDDHNYEDWRSFEEQISWYLPPVNRTTWTVHLQLKDLVGNMSGAFTDDIYLDFYPPRPASESYQLGARIAAGGDGRPTSGSYQLDGATLGQALGGGRARSRWYRLESGFQGAWPSVPRGRPPAEEYHVWDSVMASSGDAPRSERYRLYGTGGQPMADGVRTSESYQLVSGFWLPAEWDVCGDDFDQDGVIGAGDIQRQIAHWRTSMGNRDPDRNPDTPNYEARFDRNLDSTINAVDIMRLAARWGRRCVVRSP